jgi:dihydrofolate synthase/folylpolyglutamate synthase
VDFRERIRINGTPVSKEYVIDFVEQHRAFFEPLHPSFFELATAMAFNYFAEQQVDVAVIEVGLGGRLDCTNIIRPDLCVITNISFDHVQFLGDTLAKIASEKAGIIKPGIPVVIGETTPETKPVFETTALQQGAPIHFAEEEQPLLSSSVNGQGKRIYQTKDYANLEGELSGLCQEKNTNTLLCAIRQLQHISYKINESNVREGFGHVCSLTGLMGRWQKIQESPTVICDTGHNKAGIQYIVEQLGRQTYRRLHIIMGMVNDKDISSVLTLLPKDATYHFTQASVSRALPATEVKQLAERNGLQGQTYHSVKEAYKSALSSAHPDDFIFVGGSTFIVADLLSFLTDSF